MRDGDGLHRGVDPTGGEHHRQAVHQVAQDFEGRAAGTQDHGGPQEGGGHGPGLENPGHLKAGAQVLAQVGVVGAAQPPQVDDAVQAGCRRGLDHVPGRLAVGGGEIPGGRGHGVHQVEGRPAPLGRLAQGFGVHDVALGQFNEGVTAPGAVAQFAQGTPQGPDPVPRGQEPGHQAPSHIAGGAGNQNRFFRHE